MQPLSAPSVTLEPSPSSPQQDPRWTPLEDMEVFSPDDEDGHRNPGGGTACGPSPGPPPGPSPGPPLSPTGDPVYLHLDNRNVNLQGGGETSERPKRNKK